MKGLFAEREGYEPAKAIQFESMDRELTVGLWNDIYTCYFEKSDNRYHSINRLENPLFFALWDKHLFLELDQIPTDGATYVYELKKHYRNYDWKGVFDLIEAILRLSQDTEEAKKLRKRCKETLESKNAGYRLINDLITPITSNVEIETIESALNSAPSLVRVHLAQALEHLSDREEPVYRNSIKESISAVETLCCLIADKPNASLGEAVNLISKSEVVNFHPAFAEALKKLYGWTSDEEGIRHSLMDESNLSQEDARFMLVACSTFTNYLIVKADKAGKNLRQ